MNRLLSVLALAVLSLPGCRAFGPHTGGVIGRMYGGGCDEACACGDACECGDSCGCGDACGCAECGGGCCGECQGGLCDAVVSDCPMCQCAGDCQMFNRYCGTCGCGPTGYGGCEYDYSACNACGHCGGRGCSLCGMSGCCCGPTPCGANCPRPACASGDHVYNFAPGPPVGQTAYPYYTVRGPRDFLLDNPPPIGPY